MNSSSDSLPAAAPTDEIDPNEVVAGEFATNEGMAGESGYTLADDSIVHEAVDGDVILINLSNGLYYSLTPVGGAIRTLLLHGFSLSQTVDCCRRAGVSPELLGSDLQSFLDQLCEEGLLRRGAATNTKDLELPDITTLLDGPDRHQPPLARRFSDMDQLLLADPIHDTEEHGWPVFGAESASAAG